MNGSRDSASPPDEPAAPQDRPSDRPPVGRFLLLFGGLLAAALSLAALAPDAGQDPAAPVTGHATAQDAR